MPLGDTRVRPMSTYAPNHNGQMHTPPSYQVAQNRFSVSQRQLPPPSHGSTSHGGSISSSMSSAPSYSSAGTPTTNGGYGGPPPRQFVRQASTLSQAKGYPYQHDQYTIPNDGEAYDQYTDPRNRSISGPSSNPASPMTVTRHPNGYGSIHGDPGMDMNATYRGSRPGDMKDDTQRSTLPNFKVMSPMNQFERALKELEGVEDTTKRLLKMPDLQASLQDRLRVILDAAREAQKILEDEVDRDDREDIPFLLDWENLKWDMHPENPSSAVRAYRARACKEMHENYLYQEYHFPKYYSSSPLPPRTAPVYLHVSLSKEVGPSGKVSVELQPDSSADTVIHETALKMSIRHDRSSMVLKNGGTEEYMEGPRRLVEYDSIRSQLRHHANEIKLVIVARPQMPADHYPTSALAYEQMVSQEDANKVLLDTDFPRYPVKMTNWEDMEYIPIKELKQSYRIQIKGVDNLSKHSAPSLDYQSEIFVRTFLFYGTNIIRDSCWESDKAPAQSSVRWMQWLESEDAGHSIWLDNLPRATRIALCLCQRSAGDVEKDRLLSWVVINMIDECGQLESGTKCLKMWPATHSQQDALQQNWIFFCPTRPNEMKSPKGHQAVTLTVHFEEFSMPVIAPWFEAYQQPKASVVGPLIDWKDISNKERTILKSLCAKDPLYVLTEDEKATIWKYRHHLQRDPMHLSRVLQSVNWMSQEHVHEAHRLLAEWEKPKEPVTALEMLGIEFHDYKVRSYAVKCLQFIPDSELQLFLLQLVQILKFEPYHDSPLCRFLMFRAIQNPYQVGHHFFWHLKSEVLSSNHSERFAMIMEEYLYHVGKHVMELRKQSSLCLKLQRIADTVQTNYDHGRLSPEQISDDMKQNFGRLNVNWMPGVGKFQLVLDPRVELCGVDLSSARIMSSKKKPLMIKFRNADPNGGDVPIIFKNGDDLRQDILTLQLLRIMDKIWLSEEIDCRLLPYNCIATGVTPKGEGAGMIEVVQNSETTASIQVKFGGGAVGAFKTTTLSDFLRKHNPTDDAFSRAQENFARTCAGYCVATYILGIGDRHPGNIMLTKDGHLFHIDFGHFLGNFKSKMGVKRERCPFVFTPEMAFVLGGRKFKKHPLFDLFKKLCTGAFNAIRKHGPMFIILFQLMVAAGMPELETAADIEYLRERLLGEKSNNEAEKVFQKEIKNSLHSTTRQLDNLFHNIRHGK